MEYDLIERRMGIWILVLAVAAWAVAQIIKVLVPLCREHRLDLERVFGSGGMPSSHSAFVCACSAATGQLCGWRSALFAISVVIAIIVMYERVFGSGGMPSSHSAFVCACSAATGQLCGWRSALFAISVVIAIIVMYDAANIRQAAGKHAKILNHMMAQWTEKGEMPSEIQLKELLGHTPIQVIAGAALGIAIGLLGAMLAV